MFSKPEPMSEPHPLGLNMPNPPEKKPTFMPGAKSMALSGVTNGLTPAGTNAPDLDVPVRQPMNPPTTNAPRP
jgi:hypothetical protein